jgi:parvulin-like peptidyl-prolyl isomerase
MRNATKIVVFCLLLLLTGWLFVGRPVCAETGKTIAYVNGDSISADRVQRELMRIHSSRAHSIQRGDFDIDRLVNKLIDDRLIAQDARLIGLEEDPDVIERVTRFRENLALRALLDDVSPDTFTVSEAEIRAEFERDYQRFDIRLLVVNDSAFAEVLADSIRRGASMSRLAGMYSVGRYKETNGATGIHTLVSTPEKLQPYLLESDVGDLIGPLYLWRLFSLIRPEARLKADTTQWDSLRPILEQKIHERKLREARSEYAAQLRGEIPVAVDSVIIDSFLVRTHQGLPASNRPIITVGSSKNITESEFRMKYMFRTVEETDTPAPLVFADVLDEQTGILLLKEEAERKGYFERTQFDENVKILEDSLLIQAYINEIILPRITLSPKEIETYYQEHQRDYRTSSQLKISTLSRETREDAEKDLKNLQTGTDFVWLARRNSIDAARENGGARGWVNADEIPLYIFQTLDTSEVGEFSGPFFFENGFTIFQLNDRRDGEPLPLAFVTEQIRGQLLQSKRAEAMKATIAELREQADIRLLENEIQNLRISGQMN